MIIKTFLKKMRKAIIQYARNSFILMKLYFIALYYIVKKEKWILIQREQLCKILMYAYNHSRYYHDLIKPDFSSEYDVISYLKLLPLLSKDIIRREQNNIYSDEIDTGKSKWRNTGGSTGEPLRFPILESTNYWEGICQMILYIQMGYKPGDLIVSLDGARISEEKQNKDIFWEERVSNFPYGKLRYSTLFLNERTVPYYIESLNRVKPNFMRGYPSGFMELCKLMEKMQLCIKFKLKAVYLTSENFSAEEKAYISSLLKCPVYGQYGHTECSVFATQGSSDMQYLASPLYGYTEVVDEEGVHVEIGERGEIVVTGFSQLGLPFIRYKTGDLAIYGGRNKYGETILSTLLGRTIDYIYNNKGEKVYTVGFIFGGHLKAFNSIRNWQIEQNEKGRLLIRIVKGEDFNKEKEHDLHNFFTRNDFDIEINYVEEIPRTQRGKQLFLIQNCK